MIMRSFIACKFYLWGWFTCHWDTAGRGKTVSSIISDTINTQDVFMITEMSTVFYGKVWDCLCTLLPVLNIKYNIRDIPVFIAMFLSCHSIFPQKTLKNLKKI